MARMASNAKILKTWNPDLTCLLLYDGELSHSQNRTLVNVLSIPLTHVSEVESVADCADVFITVDTIPDRCLDKDIDCLMAIDHHRNSTKKAKLLSSKVSL